MPTFSSPPKFWWWHVSAPCLLLCRERHVILQKQHAYACHAALTFCPCQLPHLPLPTFPCLIHRRQKHGMLLSVTLPEESIAGQWLVDNFMTLGNIYILSDRRRREKRENGLPKNRLIYSLLSDGKGPLWLALLQQLIYSCPCFFSMWWDHSSYPLPPSLPPIMDQKNFCPCHSCHHAFLSPPIMCVFTTTISLSATGVALRLILPLPVMAVAWQCAYLPTPIHLQCAHLACTALFAFVLTGGTLPVLYYLSLLSSLLSTTCLPPHTL